MDSNRPEPEITFDGIGYFAAAAQGVLELSRCATCKTVFHYPRLLCPRCSGESVETVVADGRGTVYSYTVIHRAPQHAFADQVPYVLALIDTVEGARIFSRLDVADAASMQVGMAVQARFDPIGDTALVVFVPAEEKS